MTLIDTPGIASLSDRRVGPHHRLPHPRRGPGHPGRRRALPDAPPARHRHQLPRGVPRRGVLAGHAGQRGGGAVPGRRGRRRPHRLDGVGPAHRRPLPRTTPRSAGWPRPSCRSPACWPSRAPRCARPSTRRSTPSPRRRRDDAEALFLSADRFVQADDADPAHVDGARAPARPVRPVRGAAGGGPDPAGRGHDRHRPVDRAGAAQRARSSCATCCSASSPSAATCSRPARRCWRSSRCCTSTRCPTATSWRPSSSASPPAPTSSPRSACSTPCGPAASKVKPAEADEMERLLGAEGTALHVRLGPQPRGRRLRGAAGAAATPSAAGSGGPRARCRRARWPTPREW